MRITDLYSIFLFLILVIFPWWLVPQSVTIRILLFVCSLGFIFVSNYLLRKIIVTDVIEWKGFAFNWERKWFLLFAVLLMITHLYAWTFPIQPSDDEHFHVSKAVYIVEPIHSLIFENPLVLIGALIGLGLLLGILYYGWKRCFEIDFLEVKTIIAILVLSSVYFAAGLFMYERFASVLLDGQSLSWLIRFPPFGTILNSSVVMLGIFEVFLLRLTQFLLFVGAAWFVYKTGTLFLKKKEALVCAGVFLSIPSIFFFGNLAFMTGGVLFFICASTYYFLKYMHLYLKEHTHDHKSLGWTFFFLTIGFFYKEPLLFLWGIFFISLGLELFILKRWKIYGMMSIVRESKYFLMHSGIFLFAAISWIVVRSIYFLESNSQQQGLVLSNLLSLEHIFNYVKIIPDTLSWTLLIVFAVTVLFIAAYKRFKIITQRELYFVRFFALMIGIFFVVYVLYNWEIAIIRFLVTIAAGVVLLVGYGLQLMIPKKNFVFGVLVVLMVVLGGQSIFLTYQNIGDRYWPYDEVYSYLGESEDDGKILFLTQNIDYYAFEHEIKRRIILGNLVDQFASFEEYKDVSWIVLANPENKIYTSLNLYDADVGSERFHSNGARVLDVVEHDKRYTIVERFGGAENELIVVKVD